MPKNKTCNSEIRNFYCINCGSLGIPLAGKKGQKRKEMHRKKLWCYKCQTFVNHVEIKTLDEKNKFLKDFNNGLYKEEAQESIQNSKENYSIIFQIEEKKRKK